MDKLFRRRPHAFNIGLGERAPVELFTGVWRNSWVMNLPFGLRLSRIPSSTIMSTREEWDRRDRLIKALMPVYWEATRMCQSSQDLLLLRSTLEVAETEVVGRR